MSAFLSVFRDPDLRKKILFTVTMIILYRIGSQIPTPGVDYSSISDRLHDLNQDQSSVYSMINLFSGGALLQLSIFAIGIMPYITASIIVQLLTVVIPKFEQLKKEGQSGQAKMTEYTRYLTVGLALLQSAGIVALADRQQLLGEGVQVLDSNVGTFGVTMMVLVMTAGAVLVMWLGELITDKGIGNGMSLLIFAGIATRLPADGAAILRGSGGLAFALVVVGVLILVIGVIFIEQGQRRIPVQYAKRMVGRRQYGETSTYLPLKVNQAGVIPVIFASSLIYVPVLITQIVNSSQTNVKNNWWQRDVIQYLQNPASWQYIVLYFALIIFFSFFYVSIQYDPYEQADNMKKYGGFIPGVRPGRPTAEYLGYVMNRLLFVGSLYLGVIAVLPNILIDMGISSSGGTHGSLPFGGTAILILVSVGLTTVQQIESQLMQSNYEGFLK
ncbi:preprotein translocase subunit SecY [Corynebacterium pseudokroppenstedtii]|uniref:Protein translocase subunit SecY n=1 Tax=Corynebacterium pseudokroppenstedtii TaxID=2804917 RepID=A0AAU0PZK2_9CORY|nr:preprotein translocase subunit SecY [Corynebacterium pseudokroppenstedtii]QRP14124.1 preprotein translocase subunit SecY [Corynebacterium kroppenstedtii]MBY0790246.1 preprotein translocase subunit SecY [Corynebacterium pseudokroppenstedtii]MCF6793215.1 preprotein translocase subunit SecY [Corynebacterium pseudokroppenstedtii]MCF8701985.1 preprotein translocase subunit SecY [Corynebacterium pseudokroppenstedtii]MCG2635867.1 preprotein translocase subunit SecY [Corynebacterium pseudokroppenst